MREERRIAPDPETARRGAAAPAAALPHLLQAALLPVSHRDHAHRRAAARAAEHRAHRVELHEGAARAEEGRDLPRRLLHQPVRPASLRDLLPRLHGEGVGRALRRDPRRLGRAAREGALAQEGRGARGQGSALERLQEGAAGARDEPHHPLLLSQVRARSDVGDRRRRDHEGGRRDPPRLLRRRRVHRGWSRHRGRGRGSGDGRAHARGVRLLLLDDAGEGAGEADRARAAGARARGRRGARVPRLPHRRAAAAGSCTSR